jgi:hypothetical protein
MRKIAAVVLVVSSFASAPAFAKGLNVGLGVGVGVAGAGVATAPLTVNAGVGANVTGLRSVVGKNGLLGNLLKNGLSANVGAGASVCGCN